ncbi:hypothetical protein NXX40_19070 [Parabacteroides distasonis]|nr:hypothetical protein [Parabacteroides distasonis]
MSLAKQIGSVAKTALSNAGHMSMNNEIYARILDTTVTALHLGGPCAGLQGMPRPGGGVREPRHQERVHRPDGGERRGAGQDPPVHLFHERLL